ncbi:DNA mismatch repair protein MutS [Francisella tularensis]|nr:DNA mismatch repair protein MutS [Francisella tularensis]
MLNFRKEILYQMSFFIYMTIKRYMVFKKLLSEKNTPEITNINNRIHQLDELVTLLDKAIIENPPNNHS